MQQGRDRMRRRTWRFAGRFSAAVLAVGLLAFPAGVAATTSEPIAQTGGMTATLPLLGTSLTVDVTLDTVGNISGVTLTPPGDFASTKTRPDSVKLANAAGTTTVSVKAKRDKLSISARSARLADLVGDGTWSADVFGTGAKSTVAYTIGDDGSGNPTLAIGAVTPVSGITAEVIAPRMKVEGDEAKASGGVTFSREGFVKRLKISVEVDTEDGHASLKITLSGKDRQTLTGSLADLAGARTWSAHLCDGTAVSVSYHVAADGTVVYDGATGAPATAKSSEHGLKVRFDGTKVGVKIKLRANDDGTFTLVVKGSSGKCGGDKHDGAATRVSGSHDRGSRHRGSNDGDSRDAFRESGSRGG